MSDQFCVWSDIVGIVKIVSACLSTQNSPIHIIVSVAYSVCAMQNLFYLKRLHICMMNFFILCGFGIQNIDLVVRKRAEYFYMLLEIANFGWKMADGRLLFER